jgi:hypothetical protein
LLMTSITDEHTPKPTTANAVTGVAASTMLTLDSLGCHAM